MQPTEPSPRTPAPPVENGWMGRLGDCTVVTRGEDYTMHVPVELDQGGVITLRIEREALRRLARAFVPSPGDPVCLIIAPDDAICIKAYVRCDGGQEGWLDWLEAGPSVVSWRGLR